MFGGVSTYLSQVREGSSSTGELAHEPAVAGVTPGVTPVAVHRAVSFLPSTTTVPVPVWRNGGTLHSILPRRSVVVQAETEVKQLSAFLDLLACRVQRLACIGNDS